MSSVVVRWVHDRKRVLESYASAGVFRRRVVTKQYLRPTCELSQDNKPMHGPSRQKNSIKGQADNMKVNDRHRLLAEALQDRNSDVNTTELLRELSSVDQDVRGSWISENLGHENLLTKEELYL